MRHLLLFSFFCLWGCASNSPHIRTFADLEAESWRLGMTYAGSQLSKNPQQSVTPSDAEYRWFYQLPLSERAVYIAYRFTVTPPGNFDGEVSESMQILLTRPREWSPFAAADPTYTASLFTLLDSYSENQLRNFAAYVGGNVEQFHKNLSMWKAIVQRDQQNPRYKKAEGAHALSVRVRKPCFNSTGEVSAAIGGGCGTDCG